MDDDVIMVPADPNDVLVPADGMHFLVPLEVNTIVVRGGDDAVKD